MNILVLGATGMLGHVLFKRFSQDERYKVYGAVRNLSGLNRYFNLPELDSLITGTDADNFEALLNAFKVSKPDVVINCIGLIKHLPSAKKHLMAINVNSLFPHKLASLCEIANARLIHISTDCVFNGNKGNYTEEDQSDAEDVYGKTKFLGEIDYPHTVTLRTSIIGHELQSNIALIDWYLSQEAKVKGYSRAIYTGLTTYEMANVIMNYVIPNERLSGLFQVASEKINKYDLLRLLASYYPGSAEIEEFSGFVLDRSLCGDKFNKMTGYKAPSWSKMISDMKNYHTNWDCYRGKFDGKYRA